MVEFRLFFATVMLAVLVAAVVDFSLLLLQYLLIMISAPGVLDDSFITMVRIDRAAAIGNGCAFISYPYLIRLIFSGRELRDERIERSLSKLTSVTGMKFMAEKIYAIKDGRANGVLAGLFRKTRHIFITDKLLERMNEEEIMAILAHARYWHLTRMLLTIIGWITIVQSVLQLADFNAFLNSIEAYWQQVVWIGVVTLGNIYTLMFLVMFPLSRRQEYQADATAAPWLGLNRYKLALHRLYEINGKL